MGLGTRLSKLENQGRRHGLLRNEEQIARRLGGALVALVHWATQSRLFSQAELAALRNAMRDPLEDVWPLDDPRLPLALGVERQCPLALLRAVRSAWADWYTGVALPRGGLRREWLHRFPPCMPSGRLAFAASAALGAAHDEEEQTRIMDTVDRLLCGGTGGAA